MSDAEATAVVLDDGERRFLRAALLEWGGPARPTDELAAAMGFSSAERMAAEAWHLWHRIEAGDALTAGDWRRVLLAAEIVFVSDVVRSGLDWATTSGMPDSEALVVLRGLQRRLPRWRGSAQFTVNDAGRVTMTDPERLEP
ncbi:hypothetical protein [Thalassiella azotivora]